MNSQANLRPFRPLSNDSPSELAARSAESLACLLKPTSEAHNNVTTAAAGANWTALPDLACDEVVIQNPTGTDIEVRRGGAGVGFPIFNGSGQKFRSIANANELEVRRKDQSNVQVTVPFLYSVF